MSTEAQQKRFQKLPEEWRNDMMSRKDPEELNKFIRDASINNVVLALAKAADPDLASLKEQVKTAEAVYKDGTKTNNLKIEFLVEVLRSMGVAIPDVSAFCKALADADKGDGTVDVQAAVKEFTKGVATGLGEGNSVTISVPSTGKSVTIKGKGKGKGRLPDDEDDHNE